MIDRLAAYSWRLLAIGLAVAALLWLTGQLLVVVVPVAVAILLARALWPLSTLMRRRLAGAPAAALTLTLFLVLLIGSLTVAGAAVVGEVDELGPTVSQGLDDVADWLVDDSPFDVSRADVDRWRDRAGAALSSFVSSGERSVVSGAVLGAEVVVGLLLALIVTFFILKDGGRMASTIRSTLPAERSELGMRCVRRAWDALGGYLRGAAILGVVEAVAIGATTALVGARLVVPVMFITFIAAFVPIIGAITAGVVAVLVTLVTAGTVPALIVAAVVLVVQQLDNDLLAPVIYGRALQLHPLVILLGIGAGGALFGLVGTVFAVPFLAASLNVLDELRVEAMDHPPESRPTGDQ